MGAEEGRTMSAVLLPLLTDKWTPGGRLFTFYAHIETGMMRKSISPNEPGARSWFAAKTVSGHIEHYAADHFPQQRTEP